MRTKKDCIDATADQRQRLVHLVVDGVQHRHVEQTAPDAGLIGCHHHAVAGLVQARDGFQTAGNGAPFFRVLDELLGVEVDDAVAVEDDELHAANLEMSADWFISRPNCCNNTARFKRSALSSAITITLSKKSSMKGLSVTSVFRLLL